jgi:hypothetical protein
MIKHRNGAVGLRWRMTPRLCALPAYKRGATEIGALMAADS